ncbi:NEDD8-conjugating enzyme Ubc12 [Cichlidogyrus casuarinus]|uniref:NEDD8-conjugating enzyme Ubc12 n=1 Tax=Cichlidogyrus casuarinus TaxID=1844966 RepID=A0ABD2PTQ0_9PLAT
MDYPHDPPNVSCFSEIAHPNIDGDMKQDNICLNVLSDWSNHYSLLTIINGLIFLLNNPNFGDPNNSLHDWQDIENIENFYKDELEKQLPDSTLPLFPRYALWASKHKFGKFAEVDCKWEGSDEDDFAETDDDESRPVDRNVSELVKEYAISQYSINDWTQGRLCVSTTDVEPQIETPWYNSIVSSAVFNVVTVSTLQSRRDYFYCESGSRYAFLCMRILHGLREASASSSVKSHMWQLGTVAGNLYTEPRLRPGTENTFCGYHKYSSNDLYSLNDMKPCKPAPNDPIFVPSDGSDSVTEYQQQQIYENDSNTLRKIIPWSALFRQSRWPFSFAPGIAISNYFFDNYIFNPAMAQCKRASSHRLLCDVFRNPADVIIANGFVSWVSLTVAAALSITCNWIGYINRCELYATVGHTRPHYSIRRITDNFAVDRISFLNNLPMTRPLLGGWPLALAHNLLRQITNFILRQGVALPQNPHHLAQGHVFDVVQTKEHDYSTVILLPFTDVDDI